GRATSALELTAAEIGQVIAAVEELGRAAGLAIACAPAGDFRDAEDVVDAKMPVFFAIGFRACIAGQSANVDDLQRALEASRAVPQSLWDAVRLRVRSEMTEDPALHLVVAGADLGGLLRFVAKEKGSRRLNVGMVLATGKLSEIIDVSSRA